MPYIDIRVVGEETELKSFLRLCRIVTRCGLSHARRTVEVDVDGESSDLLFGTFDGGRSATDTLTMLPSAKESVDGPLKLRIGK